MRELLTYELNTYHGKLPTSYYPAVLVISEHFLHNRQASRLYETLIFNATSMGHCLFLLLNLHLQTLMLVVWVVTPCGLIDGNERFGGMIGTLKKETAGSSETLVTSNKTTQCHNSEDQHRHLHCENLRSWTAFIEIAEV
jgi:hypothetical protein